MTKKTIIKDLILKTEKIDWQKLQDLQPVNLKNNYHSEKVKKSLISNGFANSIYVWEDKNKDIFVVDGHCRKDVLIELISEGYEIPDKLNCTFLDLPNKKTAVKYLLQVFNQKTNAINQDNLNIWLEDIDITLDSINIDLDELHIDLLEEKKEEEVNKDTDLSDNLESRYILEIDCESEMEQEILYNRFLEENLKVKILSI